MSVDSALGSGRSRVQQWVFSCRLPLFFFFSSRRRHTRSVSAFLLNRSSDLEKWLNMLGTFVKDWFRYESHFVHGRDSLVDILKERGLLSESDAVQPLIGKKS